MNPASPALFHFRCVWSAPIGIPRAQRCTGVVTRCRLRVAGATAWLHVLGDDTPAPTPELVRRGVEACAIAAVPAGIGCRTGWEKQSAHGPESRRASFVRMLAIASRVMTGRFGNRYFKVKASRQLRDNCFNKQDSRKQNSRPQRVAVFTPGTVDGLGTVRHPSHFRLPCGSDARPPAVYLNTVNSVTYAFVTEVPVLA